MTAFTDTLPALAQRLRAIAGVLLDDVPPPAAEPAHDVADLLAPLVDLARRSGRADHAWILLAALSGHLPQSDDVDDVVRLIELATSPAEAEIGLLRRARATIAAHGGAGPAVEVVEGAVVVDVTFSAQNDKHTGIQRVVREICPRWDAAHDITLVAWAPSQSALRTLRPHEKARVLAWSDTRASAESAGPRASAPARTLIPWRCTVVLPEVAQGTTAGPLTAIAQHSGNTVVAVGYDAIPVVSADLRPVPEPNQFVGYLTAIKYARRVAGISASSAAEFQGFSDAVKPQGLPGPEVVEVQLAAEGPPAGSVANSTLTTADAHPVVLCVGSHEPHKNHLALLHAAERLWREGLEFDLVFIGGPGWDTSGYDTRVAELVTAGRPLEDLGSVTDDELWDRYRSARFSVFPSLHEGFGLPVAESLACGTPVVTTAYGSTQEIASGGGCLLADPRDDDDLMAKMRALLTDDDLYHRLKAEAFAERPRSWDTYAAELWESLVEGTRSSR